MRSVPTPPHIPPVNEAIREAAQAASSRLPRGHMSELARKIGTVERNAVTTWFSGRSTPDKDHWDAIEEHLGMEPGTLRQIAADYFDPRYAEIRADYLKLQSRLARTLARAGKLRDELERRR